MRHIESKIQQNCVKWFRYQYPNYSKLLFAVPNGGARNPSEARIMKAEGVVAGVSDMILLLPRGEYGSLCIEFKTEKGRQTDLQKDWQKQIETAGNKYVVIRNIEQFVLEIYKYLQL